MTDVDVRDETGDHAWLAEHIRDVITDAAPLVEQTTGLPLPGTVTYRLMHLKPWAQAAGAFYARMAERDTVGMTLTPMEQKQIAAFAQAGAMASRFNWIVIDSWTMKDSIGRAQTLIVPEALRHQGALATPEALREQVVRGLTHQTQITASNSTVVPPRIWPLEKSWWCRLESLMDGHANWVCHEVAPHLPNRPATGFGLPKSRRYQIQFLIHRLIEPGISKRKLQA
ncbi:hypothetical protein V2J94_37935 [Streptomyces sp. DSM 41524]|uniref:Uncharacterized protein n=1 Tax=Streptomyces asiaticus subsp. ignotus TaxID=3098222 RepID=A0ABU7Q8K0_9ACTN|nr:hypothetical protein [Streptomyces sp. DSM 41524]